MPGKRVSKNVIQSVYIGKSAKEISDMFSLKTTIVNNNILSRAEKEGRLDLNRQAKRADTAN